MSKKGLYLGGNQTLKVKNHFDLADKKTWLFNKGQMTESAVDANRSTRGAKRQKEKFLKALRNNKLIGGLEYE
tara:strand:- start:25 stop:243 length:219 start_codon:yes stop_codon:yes gene_type:complete